MNIEPERMKPHPDGWMAGPGRAPIFTPASFPSAAAKTEFDKRLRLLDESLFKSGFFTVVNNLVQGGRHLATISLREFAVWGLHVEFEDMPLELVAMAKTNPESAQAVTPEPQAAPLVSETVEQRCARYLAMFETEEKREKRGALQRVADSEGVDRSNMRKDIDKAQAARDKQKRAGEWASQLVQDGKRKG